MKCNHSMSSYNKHNSWFSGGQFTLSKNVNVMLLLLKSVMMRGQVVCYDSGLPTIMEYTMS